jgi:hypothetical protein
MGKGTEYLQLFWNEIEINNSFRTLSQIKQMKKINLLPLLLFIITQTLFANTSLKQKSVTQKLGDLR